MAALTLVVGDEELLVARAVARALRRPRRRGRLARSAPSVHDLEAGECSVELMAEVLSPSLFAEQRLLVVRNLQDADKDLVAALAEFGGRRLSRTSRSSRSTPAERRARRRSRRSRPPAREWSRSAGSRSSRDREQFAVDEVRAAGGSIDRDAAAELVAAIGNDLRELATAAAQLAADVGGPISAD